MTGQTRVLSVLLVAGFSHVQGLYADDPTQPTSAIDQAGSSADTDGPPAIVEESPALMQRGTWQYHTALDLPPAPLDFKPSLAIVNDHNATAGILGNGWLLAGVSTIERQGPTRGAPTMTDEDTFWLDGQQLYPQEVDLLSMGIHGESTTLTIRTYRLERDDNRVFRYDLVNDVWTAERQGHHWRFGTLDGSGGAATEWQTSSLGDHCGSGEPWADQQKATAWHLAEARDVFDNTISYDYTMLCECPDDELLYDRFDGEAACAPVLYQVRYGAVRVSLTYEERPDPQAKARGGRLRFLAHRLVRISSYVGTRSGEALYSRYSIRYARTDPLLEPQAFQLPGSQSTAARVSQPNAASSPSTAGSLQPGTAVQQPGVGSSPSSPGAAQPPSGPLQTELIGLVDGEMTSLKGIDRVTVSGETKTLLDAQTDLSQTDFDSPLPFKVFRNVPDYFSSTPISVNFDGDGYPDLAVLSMHCAGTGLVDCETDVRGFHNKDDGTFGFVEDDVLTALLQDGLPTDMIIWGAYLFADVDGDGRTELHLSRNSSDPDVKNGASYVLKGKNRNHEMRTDLIDLEEDELRGAQMADVDGDGFLDMVYGAAAVHAGFPTQQMIAWRRNTGREPYFESGLNYIPHPIAEDEEVSRELDGLLTQMWLDCREELGNDVTMTPWESLDWGTNELPEYGSAEDYWLGNSRLADFNSDGIVDVAFSFSVCWKTGNDPTDLEPTNYVFSRVYYGDGIGGMHDAGYGLGTAFLQSNNLKNVDRPDPSPWSGQFLDNWSSFAVSDLNGDRAAEIIYRPNDERRLRAAHFLGLGEGYGFETGSVETTRMPSGVNAISTKTSGKEAIFVQTMAIDDWDGDGLSDLLVMERKPRSSSASDLTVEIHGNARATAQHLTTGIVNEWGGAIEIGYGTSNEAGENYELPHVVRVVESVRDHRGFSRFGYSGARYEDRQFLGFAEVEGEYESGLLFEATFSLSEAFRGSLVTRAERRREGSLERFLYNDYIDREPMRSSYDMEPPFFNPVRRSCRFEIDRAGPISGSPGDSLESDLIEECLEFSPDERLGFDPMILDDSTLHGWRAGGTGNPGTKSSTKSTSPKVTNEATVADAPNWLRRRGLQTRTDVKAGKNPLVPTDRGASRADPGPEPLNLSVPHDVPIGLPARRMFVRDYDYGSHQRRTEERNYRLASEPHDNVRTEYDYGPIVVVNGQAELLSIVHFDDRGRRFRRYDFSDRAVFDAPREVAETGQFGEVRTRTRTFDIAGQITLEQTVVDRSGAVAEVRTEYDVCGLPSLITDPVGRDRSSERDGSCRDSLTRFEGGERSYQRDGFGRVTEIEVRNGVSPTQTTHHYYVNGKVDPESPHRGFLRANQLTRVFLDEWGRRAESEVCELEGPTPPPETTADELECVNGTSIRELWGYAADGSLRYHTRPHSDGEATATVWLYKDERWRNTEQQLPSHEYVGTSPALFDLTEPSRTISFTTAYGVGTQTTTGPDGSQCKRTFDTLNAGLDCSGIFRGSSKFDAMGNVVETTDASGTMTQYSYDDFFRLASATPLVSVETCNGKVSSPKVSHSHDYLGNQLSKTDADGTRHEWFYDSARRPLGYSILPADGGSRVVLNRWRYFDGPPTGSPPSPDGRRVEELDPNSNITTRFLDGFGWTYATETPAGDLAFRRRDPTGRVIQSTDIDGLRTRYEYDVHDRLLSEYVRVVEGRGIYCPAGSAGTDGFCRIEANYEYDGAGRVTAFTDADGVRREYGYTESGRLALATMGDWVLSAALYDDYANPTWTWRDGVKSEFNYDNLWRVAHECRGVYGGTCVQEIDFTHDAEDRIASRSIGGATTTYERDYRGRVLVETHPNGNSRTFVYGLNTGVCQETDEDGSTSAFEYDSLGRLISDKPHERKVTRRVEYEFGIPGAAFGLDTNLSRSRSIESDGSVWDTYFDFANREVALVRPDSSTILTSYEGSLAIQTRLVDAVGAVQEIVANGYDALSYQRWQWGPVSEATYDAGNGSPGVGDYAVFFRHTPAGRVAQVDGPLNAASGRRTSSTLFGYDDAGLPISEDMVGITRITTGYDREHGFPRPKTRTVGAGTADPRVTTISYADGGLSLASVVTEGPRTGSVRSRRETIEHIFDHHDRYGTPRLEEAWTTLGGARRLKTRYRLATDIMGWTESVDVEVANGVSGRAEYSYFGDGLVESVVTDWAGGLRFRRGGRGNIRVVEGLDSAGGSLGELARVDLRDAMQRPVEIDLASGASVERRYDLLGRLEWQQVTSPSAGTDERAYSFNSRGLLESVQLTTDSGIRTDEYAYTQEGWLREESRRTGSTPDSLTTFTYDAAGNRTSRDTNGDVALYTYGAIPAYGTATAGSALLEIGDSSSTRSQTWDAFGGVIVDHRGLEIERDALGRVVSIWDEQGYELSRFLRDHTGRPVVLRSNAGDRTHFWGHPVSTVYPLATVDEAGVRSINAAFGEDLVGRVVDFSLENALTDPGGNLVLSDGQLLELLGAFGEEVQAPTSGLAFLFGGQELLADTPYLSAQQRIYDPETGRFASADPIGLGGGYNRFVYASNDPLGLIDPWGTEADVEDLGEFDPIDEDERAILDSGNIPIDRLVVRLSGSSPHEIVCNGECPENGVHKFPTVAVVAQPLPAEVPTNGPGLPGEGTPLTEVEPTAPQAEAVAPDESGATGSPDTQEYPTVEPSPEGQQGDEAESNSGDPETPIPENFGGTAEDLNGLLNDGYSINLSNGLLQTPGGNYVIPGVNDAQNPMPHKVLVNLAGDAIDDMANGGIPGAIAQSIGLWEGNGTPGADIASWLGADYTASEKPRETIAETAVTVVLTAGGAVAGAGAAATGRSIVARGCAGPLARLPAAIRRAGEITCFAEGTPVMTKDGLTPIEEIEVGDMVLCRNDKTGETKSCAVEHLFVSENRRVLELEIQDEDGTVETLSTTPNHRFYVQDTGWKEASDLLPEDIVVSADGDILTVVDSEPLAGQSTVYNFEVDEFESYFVGESGAWVHNQGRSCPGHRATAKLYEILENGKHRLVEEVPLVSGGTTKAIKEALSKGNARMAVHTETKYLRDVYRRIVNGDLTAPGYRVEFLGELEPCSRCRGIMDGMDFMTNVRSSYRWGNDARNIWESINIKAPSGSQWNQWYFDVLDLTK